MADPVHEALRLLLRELRRFDRRIPVDLTLRQAADAAERALIEASP